MFKDWTEMQTGGGCTALRKEESWGFFLITNDGGAAIPMIKDTSIYFGATAYLGDDDINDEEELFVLQIDLDTNEYTIEATPDDPRPGSFWCNVLDSVSQVLEAEKIDLDYKELAFMLFNKQQ